jgi:predicted HTH domain antitoxin
MLGTKLEETRVYKEAREEERNAIAVNMIRKKIDLATIAEVTGLSIEQLQKLQ